MGGRKPIFQEGGKKKELKNSDHIKAIIVLDMLISPPAILVDTPDYAPTGLATCNIAEFQATANRKIRGLDSTGIVNGQIITVINVGVGDLIFESQRAESLAQNRFYFQNTTVSQGGIIRLVYSTTFSRWLKI